MWVIQKDSISQQSTFYSTGGIWYISQTVCLLGRAARWRGPAPGAASQVGHAGAARVSLGGDGARPAHKHARLAHELLSSLRDSERPNARRSFSTNLL